jgi:hypothetical protein
VGVIIPSPFDGGRLGEGCCARLKMIGTPSSILPRQGEGGRIVVIGDSAR